MQQIIRYTQAWYVHPAGGFGVDFSTPILEGTLPKIQCACKGAVEDYIVTILGDESNYRLLIESLEVYRSLFEHKIEKLFTHYTNNPKALQIAKKIEETYVQAGVTRTMKTQDCFHEIEKLQLKIGKSLSRYE